MNPMERLKAYTKPKPDNGVAFDIDGMSIDLIIACKAARISEKEFFDWLHKTWSEVSVEVIVARGLDDLMY